MDSPRDPRQGKKARRPKARPAQPADTRLAPDLDQLIQGLLDWHLTKINGDPEEEYFEILERDDGANGRCACKFVMGDFQESMLQLQQQLQEKAATIDMYAYSHGGYWTNPQGNRHDGAIVTMETRTMIASIYGFALKLDAQGTLVISGDPIHLGPARWALFHRTK